MADVHTKKQRSYNMSQIKWQNTKPEIVLRKKLFSNGVRGYRIHYKLPGRPDIVFVRHKLAVFMDGCFWHMCSQCFQKPATRTKFWMNKIGGNIKRDKIVNQALRKEGWRVMRFWEHEIKETPEKVTSKIIRELRRTLHQ